MPEIVENNSTNTDLPVIDESIDSVSKSMMHYLKRHMAKVLGVVLCTLAIELALIIFLQFSDPRIYFYPLFIPILAYGSIRSKIEKEFMQQFAGANGYDFDDFGIYDKGSLFSVGYGQVAKNIVSGTYKNYPIRLYDFEYTTGSGKSRQIHKKTIFSLQFDAVMPDIFLESKQNNFFSLFSDLITKGVVVKLEGDFNKYFTLHVPNGYEIEALEVFTPDVMADLIDKAASFDIEISENHFILCENGAVEEKDKLYKMYEVAQYFIEKIGPVLSSMKVGLSAMELEKSSIS